LKSSFSLGSKVFSLLLIVILLFTTEILGIYVVMAMLRFFPLSRINIPLISHLLGLKTESNHLKRKTFDSFSPSLFWGERERNTEVREEGREQSNSGRRTLQEFWTFFFPSSTS